MAHVIEEDVVSDTVAFKVKAEEDLYPSHERYNDDDDIDSDGPMPLNTLAARKDNKPATKPNVPCGKEFTFLVRRTQPFLKVFQHYQNKHGLSMEHLELKFRDSLLSDEDTPNSIQLEENDTVWVRNCSNPDIVFKVKAEEDLYSRPCGGKSKKRRRNQEDDDENLLQVSAGTEVFSCLRRTQRFSYLFSSFHKCLRGEDLEFRFGLHVLDEKDTPSSIQLQTYDTIWVRKCRTPRPTATVMFEVKAEEDLYSTTDDNEEANDEDTTGTDRATAPRSRKRKRSLEPEVKAGKKFFFLLRKTQRLKKVFHTFILLNKGLKANTKLEYRFGGRVLTNEDTPQSINLQQQNVILVRNCPRSAAVQQEQEEENHEQGQEDDEQDHSEDDGNDRENSGNSNPTRCSSRLRHGLSNLDANQNDNDMASDVAVNGEDENNAADEAPIAARLPLRRSQRKRQRRKH